MKPVLLAQSGSVLQNDTLSHRKDAADDAKKQYDFGAVFLIKINCINCTGTKHRVCVCGVCVILVENGFVHLCENGFIR